MGFLLEFGGAVMGFPSGFTNFVVRLKPPICLRDQEGIGWHLSNQLCGWFGK